MTTEHDGPADIVAQVAALKRTITCLAVAWAVTWLFLTCWVAWAPERTVHRRLLAHQFRLIDDHGRSRAEIGFTGNDYTAFKLLDESGQTRAMLALRPDGSPTIRLCGTDEKARWAAFLDESGAPVAVWTGADGKPTIQAGTEGDHFLGVAVYGQAARAAFGYLSGDRFCSGSGQYTGPNTKLVR